MTKEEQYKATLSHYLPPSAVDPVYLYLNSHAVHLHITRKRNSKLGDYRMPQPRHEYHEISVNGDLTPHLFLLVLLHEMAHLNTYLQYGRKVQPHGHEWQEHYRQLLLTYSREGHFPEAVRPLLARYTSKTPLNRRLGSELERRLKAFDVPEKVSQEVLLKELPVGSFFRIKERPRILFRSMEKRRTRYRCVDVQTQAPYLVSGDAVVIQEAESSL